MFGNYSIQKAALSGDTKCHNGRQGQLLSIHVWHNSTFRCLVNRLTTRAFDCVSHTSKSNRRGIRKSLRFYNSQLKDDVRVIQLLLLWPWSVEELHWSTSKSRRRNGTKRQVNRLTQISGVELRSSANHETRTTFRIYFHQRTILANRTVNFQHVSRANTRTATGSRPHSNASAAHSSNSSTEPASSAASILFGWPGRSWSAAIALLQGNEGMLTLAPATVSVHEHLDQITHLLAGANLGLRHTAHLLLTVLAFLTLSSTSLRSRDQTTL